MAYNASPLEVQRFLAGLNFPAKKERIISHAASQNAPQPTIELLQHIDDHEYGGPIELASEIEQLGDEEKRAAGGNDNDDMLI